MTIHKPNDTFITNQRVKDFLSPILPDDEGYLLPIRVISTDKSEVKEALVSRRNLSDIIEQISFWNQIGFQIYVCSGLVSSSTHQEHGFIQKHRYVRSGDIGFRRVFVIDFDPVRPKVDGKKRASSPIHLQHSEQVAKDTQEYLKQQGIETGLACSGNGHYLVTLLPFEDPIKVEDLFKNLLKHLKEKFDNDSVEIDLAVSSNASLFRLFGTKNHCFGDNGWPVSVNSFLMEAIPTLETIPLDKASEFKRKNTIQPLTTCNLVIKPSRPKEYGYDLLRFLHILQDQASLELVYGPLLTGEHTARGDLYCTDPFCVNSSNPMGCVSTGSNYARGRFYSFASGESMTMIEFFSRINGLNYVDACFELSQITGIEIPKEK